ncbi:uncharacterized protein N7482_003031 [Penicillium canariense]|uniref:Uncharacterized protein n=1 Tax=Penicillium canariense TaxID=189055 RepID=A0A9W9LVE1_9EURO|nr:uncharacterized protein N7482_003031 [Penicillium canariense]KAJ5177154.1 hypothetical protein N7482_003031 [Penicillium canariense]
MDDKYAKYEKYYGKYDKWDDKQIRFDENNLPNKCTQMQVRYSCGHTLGGEFIKCARHIDREDERCSNRSILYVEAKQSSHKCRTCLRSG